MLFSTVLLIALVSVAQSALLRGLDRSQVTETSYNETSTIVSRRDSSSSASTFDCYLYDMDGLAPIGIEVEGMWNCEVEATATVDAKQYTILGDIESIFKKNFHEDVQYPGATRMTVPFDAVVNATLIDCTHPDIVISHDHVRHSRRLAAKTGTQQLLIIRAIDRNGNSPDHWRQHIRDDFFQDGNNLKTRLKACSNNKLNIVPATGPDVIHGVLNMKLDMTFNGKNWQDVGDAISTRLSNKSNLNYDTRIFLMPNIVDFNGAAAWAQVGGNTMWLKDSYASFPIVQVHEYGHLLGQRHSGAYGNSYSDNSCYMGNQIPWTDHGAFMCFNPAKTWFFGWYSDHHKTINPKNQAFNEDIVGIDDVVNGKAGSKRVIVKIAGDNNEFYLMYNRAKGINSEAIGGKDEVVITKQNGDGKDSNFEKSLNSGEQWVYQNFANTGKNLIVKNCYTKRNTPNGDTSRVLIYVQGLNSQQCPTGGGNTGEGNTGGGSSGGGNTGGGNTGGGNTGGGSGGTCTDKNWTDIYGDSCSWYATNNRCLLNGNVSGSNGWKANDACCVCGGGNRSGNTGGNAGGNGGESCQDDTSWYDAGGEKYTCDWYKRTPTSCEKYGNRFINFGKTANSACCVCKQ